MTVPPLPDKLSAHLSAQAVGLQGQASQGAGPPPSTPSPSTPPAPRVQVIGFEFRATGSEYARIWLVNIALSAVTLGLYLPWARIRLRQYLYQHTYLQGHSFSYDASPRAMLISYLVLGGLFWLFSLSSNLSETRWVSGVLVGLFALLYPMFLYWSLRFQARNTVYRGLRFGFGGKGLEAYALYGLLPLTYGLTAGLTVPLAQYLQRRYVASNLSYGQAAGQFSGGAGQVYLIFLVALLVYGLWVAAAVGLFFAAVARSSASTAAQGPLEVTLWLLGALLVAFLFQMLREGLHAALFKYMLEHTQLGPMKLRVRFKPLALAWVGVSNMAVQILTLGLATPWAVVRKARFVLAHIDLLSLQPLSEYRAAASHDQSSFGEAATELFDIGLGL